MQMRCTLIKNQCKESEKCHRSNNSRCSFWNAAAVRTSCIAGGYSEGWEQNMCQWTLERKRPPSHSG
ncbi:hypothetical protein CEXT_714061 [Caerostris extrusa]|uniref:Uncharacterized protein n=1 Tax=Caerostris extrusa TaxID=172846 RepID=A0AAV4N3G9_CAEEX|nr:hypothetical protein CEXT_714061 [Caerostris extrusa]